MGYQLAALIGAPTVLVGVAAALPDARVVDLTAELALVPLTEPVCAQLSAATGPADAQPVRGFRKLTGTLARLAAQGSKTAPLLYVEAETFGGPGSQAAIAWRDGRVSWGPVLTQDRDEGREDEGFVTGVGLRNWAINAGLRHLGVRKAPDAIDEFDTVGLGRHRNTDHWI